MSCCDMHVAVLTCSSERGRGSPFHSSVASSRIHPTHGLLSSEPCPDDMRGKSNFWTSSTKRDFHEAVSQLRRINDNPADQEDYRGNHPLQSEGYTLTLHDEQQLADDVAFLAHASDSVESISAVTTLEESDGITFILASNYTPTDLTVSGLRKILSIVNKYSISGKHRRKICDQVFDAIISSCKDRILERIVPTPRHFSQRPTLLSQVQNFLSQVEPKHTTSPELLEKARELTRQLGLLQSQDVQHMHNLLKSIITTCVDISTFAGTGSLENYVQSLGFTKEISGQGAIQRIDKLSRYYHISKNLTKVARKQKYLSLFRSISLVPISSFPPNHPPGSSVLCFVHAEMQQILYHERHPHSIPPRVIGCSKSACYLCDLFIQEQGCYHISIAHKRLYHMWTLPDVDWMDTYQADKFFKIIMAMTRTLRNTIKYQLHHLKDPRRPYGLESRARLPLSSSSTLSEISRIPDRATTLGSSLEHANRSKTTSMEGSYTEQVTLATGLSESGSMHSVISAKLSYEDLPFFRDIQTGATYFDIEVSSVRLCFDFTCVSMGRLRISQCAMPEEPSPAVDVASIQSQKEVKVGCSEDGSSVKFQLVHKTYPRVDVEFKWGASK